MQNVVAYLGPRGTYSHLVAEKRFGRGVRYEAQPTVLDVCTYVARHRDAWGVVPIENSSGGAIYETVDVLLAGKPRLFIYEERTLDVRLALLGRRGERITSLYSHFAPLEHCDAWIRRELPGVKKQVTTSTAMAARMAFLDDGAAALGSRQLAKIYGLDVLLYPVEADIPNLTTFLIIGGRRRELAACTRTTLAVLAPNIPGSLCSLLATFRDENVNLSRIVSRPVRGCPKEYAFLLDLEGAATAGPVRRALVKARQVCVELRVVGSYPGGRGYRS